MIKCVSFTDMNEILNVAKAKVFQQFYKWQEKRQEENNNLYMENTKFSETLNTAHIQEFGYVYSLTVFYEE